MGIVYRAQDPTIGRDVAIKTIRLNELSDASERQRLHDRLFREAQSAGSLSHPGIVTIYDVSDEGDLAYIAMECVEGPTLDRLMATDPPDGALVLSILGQTAAALDYAHKRGIVHRDIKPANIMLHEARTAKITDFGVARLQSHQMTQTGSMVGTPNYMSPEQIQGQPVDGRSDQFSLAVIAYELLAGDKPFSSESIAGLAYRIVREQPAPVHRLNSTLDWPVDTVIQRALAKLPADRYPTCSDFAFALENACRACRKWKPVPPGAGQEAVTVTGPAQKAPAKRPSTAPAQPAASAVPVLAPAAEADQTVEEQRARPPLFLRLVRLLALVVLGGALVAALLVGGLRYLEQERAAQQAAASDAKPPEAPPETAIVRKPSAMPEAPSERRTEELDKAATPEPVEPPKPNPVKPAVAAKAIPAPAGATSTRLVTNPPGAFLVVDGASELSCQSPCSIPLTRGRHTLAANMAGYRRTLRILETPKDDEVFMNLDRATGTLMVRSEPRGAAIYVNGEIRNERTPALLTLPAGAWRVELALDGQRESHEVQVKDSAITNLAVTFAGR